MKRSDILMRVFTLTLLLFCVASSGLCQEIEFDEPFDIRERLDIPERVAFQVASSGSNVYVLWIFDDTPRTYSLNLAHSNDSGNNFDVRVLYQRMSSTPPVVEPQMAVSDDTVHVAFFLGSSRSQIHYCHIPSDEDLPCRYPRIGPGFESDNLRLVASGNNVYTAWNISVGEGNVYLAYSTDRGASWSGRINLTNDEERQFRQLTDLRATGNNVYLRWDLLTFNPQRRQPILMHGAIVK